MSTAKGRRALRSPRRPEKKAVAALLRRGQVFGVLAERVLGAVDLDVPSTPAGFELGPRFVWHG